jgi:hypothetical protein
MKLYVIKRGDLYYAGAYLNGEMVMTEYQDLAVRFTGTVLRLAREGRKQLRPEVGRFVRLKPRAK